MKEITSDFPEHSLIFDAKMNDESSSANDDTDFVEITIRNNKFCSKKTRLIQLIALTKLFHLILILFIRNLHHFIHMGFFICLGILIYRLFNIVEKEVVKVLKEFGLQYSTFYSFGRQKSIFVPSSNIHKVVINEIIYFNHVLFVLQLLTEKEFFDQKPIIILFKNLLPPLNCLKLVYQKLALINR